MATSGNHDENETETTIDVSGFMRAFMGDDDDENTDESADRSGDISMFCKACLHPYCGEQKSGTIVLRCERCGQTDTVLEESVGGLKPQEWIGNLMMNRFITVVKEQEDLSANLSDPYFAEDDYQRMSLFLTEYTFNVEKIAVHLFDIAKKAKLASEEDKERIEDCQKEDASIAGLAEVQAMNATKTLLEIHKTLIMNDKKQHIDSKANKEKKEENETETSPESTCLSDGQLDKGSEKHDDNNAEESKDISKNLHNDELQNTTENQGDQLVSDENVTAIEEKREIIRGKLNQIGQSIYSLIENLMAKYNIPDDVMATVHQRLRNAQTVKTAERNEHVEEKDSKTASNIDTDDNKDKSSTDKEADDSAMVHQGNTDKEENCDTETETEEPRTIFNVSTETIRNEVYNALGHKLKLIFDNKQCATRRLDWNQTDDDSDFEFPTKEETTKDIDTPISQTSQDIVNDDKSNPDTTSENTIADKASECIKNDKETSKAERDPDGFEVNFYSLASEFIRELQRRKCISLNERKNKALANIHDKIERLKKEMIRVEEVVTEELALAYKRKMKKVDKQKKQMDEKHSQIKEAERLLEYYAMTGQEDKIAELAAQFNIQFEN